MYLLLLLTSVLSPCVRAEIFTSMADMEQMVLSEKNMLSALKQYVTAEETKLSKVKEFLARVNDALQYVTQSDVGKYLGNPVNSYLMLKRFNVDWKQLEKTLETNSAQGFNTVFEDTKPYFPTQEDQEGAMDALFRLQSTYKLKADTLYKGIIPGVKQVMIKPMTLHEIFEIGQYAYDKRKWDYASQWLQAALEVMGEQAVSKEDIRKADILDHLAFSLYQIGEDRKSYNATLELHRLLPGDQRVLDNLEFFENNFKQLESAKRGETLDTISDEGKNNNKTEDAPVKSPEQIEKENRIAVFQNYEALCRGEVRNLTKREQRRMKCWYRNKHPMLRIKPQKVERIWVKPEIFLFRDILSDTQIEWIKETAYPQLRRATIQDPVTGKLRYADYRVSKSAWLNPIHHPEVEAIQTRAEAVTGLNLTFAEQLQIANYGIGGHYEPHFDHAREDEDQFSDLGMGNRVATLLFYLSDVEAGGPTVFVNAQAAVYPSKNDAVFWYNLKRNGKGNKETRHAACPVLVGQKWVSNWWIHEWGQFLRRPCALDKDW